MLGMLPNPERRKLSAEDLTQVQTVTTDRLRAMVDDLSRDAWLIGLDWYWHAHKEARSLGQRVGMPTEAVAAVIAVLSPRCSWENNLDDARLMLDDGLDNGFFAFNANVAKAAWILEGVDASSVLGGRKVRAFWRNIANPEGSLDVTLDTHMSDLLDLPNDKYLQRAGVYDAISAAFRIVAEEHAILPHQLQAALWVQKRDDV
jgi:hypothetical protein